MTLSISDQNKLDSFWSYSVTSYANILISDILNRQILITPSLNVSCASQSTTVVTGGNTATTY